MAHSNLIYLHCKLIYTQNSIILSQNYNNTLNSQSKKIIGKNRGSVGIIYVGYYKCNEVAIKVVPENIKDIIKEETSILNFVKLFGLINSKFIAISDDLKERMMHELEMELELKNYLMIRNVNLDIWGARTLTVIPELCSKNYFIYEYEYLETIDKYSGVRG